MADEEPKKKRRHVIVKIVSWGFLTAAFTVAISYFTRGYWEPEKNVHFIEFATIVLTLCEDA